MLYDVLKLCLRCPREEKRQDHVLLLLRMALACNALGGTLLLHVQALKARFITVNDLLHVPLLLLGFPQILPSRESLVDEASI